VSGRQRCDRTDSLAIIKERMRGDVESIGLFTDERSKRGIEIGFAVNLKTRVRHGLFPESNLL
jgi:hypothetical protein